MVNINRRQLEENLKKKAWDILLKKIIKIKSQTELEKLLREFFSESERIMIEKRLAIKYLTQQAIKYNDICRILDISSATLSFVRREFQKKPKKEKQNKNSKIINAEKKRKFKFPPYRGKGRWSFLNSL